MHRRVTGYSHFVQDVVLSSDGQFALFDSLDGELRFWDLASGTTARRFVGHTKDVLSIAFSLDNRQIVSASCNQSIKLWNTLGAICCAAGENLWWLVALYDTNYNICAVINILESSEVHSEDNKALPEKIKTRTFKTPSQVEALEKFYIESVGLLEKQVSRWFCPRRLKYKKHDGETAATGRQDRSRGIGKRHGHIGAYPNLDTVLAARTTLSSITDDEVIGNHGKDPDLLQDTVMSAFATSRFHEVRSKSSFHEIDMLMQGYPVEDFAWEGEYATFVHQTLMRLFVARVPPPEEQFTYAYSRVYAMVHLLHLMAQVLACASCPFALALLLTLMYLVSVSLLILLVFAIGNLTQILVLLLLLIGVQFDRAIFNNSKRKMVLSCSDFVTIVAFLGVKI
ncbi:hypothetical protein RHSIM_RhsimUnG0145700 [Rhododendron simsii]|uniref:Homeobox domain-containing protein n=1 Tax=Rhododendron simsii TaxID=118357 RepID=A0A834G0F9_RHOSS|nr:hypothetical protein RHSIM_RhsimUnG0145700 [Rhododendron simsii]